MKAARNSTALTVIGAILYNLIFWNEIIGVNALLFDLFIFGALFYLLNGKVRSRQFWLFLAIHLFSLSCLILQNTDLSKVSWMVTLMLTVVFAHYVHRSVWFAGGAAMLSFAVFPSGFRRQISFNYFLYRVNALAVVIALAIGSSVDWDVTIAKYNIAHADRTPLDLPFVLSLSDHTLPVLETNMSVLLAREAETKHGGQIADRMSVEGMINWRKAIYLDKQQRLSWLSWNRADDVAINQLKP